MKESLLTQQDVRDRFEYSPETGCLYHKRAQGAKKIGSVAGTMSNRYLSVSIQNKIYRVHRVIWLHQTGAWPNGEIDHIDGNPINNKIENLRVVDRVTNKQNARIAQKNNACGFLGVHCETRRKSPKKWKAVISVGGKVRVIGFYLSAEEAHRAYVETKRLVHPGCTI